MQNQATRYSDPPPQLKTDQFSKNFVTINSKKLPDTVKKTIIRVVILKQFYLNCCITLNGHDTNK
jgi:hypothetical protein